MHLDPRTDENRQLQHVREDLLREFASLPPSLVEENVSLVESGFTQATIRSFVPVLVRRGAQERLRHLTSA
jgi:hypothetical protein